MGHSAERLSRCDYGVIGGTENGCSRADEPFTSSCHLLPGLPRRVRTYGITAINARADSAKNDCLSARNRACVLMRNAASTCSALASVRSSTSRKRSLLTRRRYGNVSEVLLGAVARTRPDRSD